MADLLQTYDWKVTPLGDPAHWPQSLRTAIQMMMASGHAMCLAWGPKRTFLYNDAYVPMLGARHPQAFGAPFGEAWPDIWSEIAPLVDRTFAGETSTFENMPLTMQRNGYPEETWWTFSYSPVEDESGDVAGLLNVTVETTGRVLAERDRDEAVERLRRNEARWRRIFHTLREGFILAELVRDETGRVIDWRYEEVNDAWYDLVGIERGCAVGRTIREVFPGIEDSWVKEFAGIADAGEPIRFTRQVGTLDRWYDGVAQHAGGDHFTVIFTEVTDRVLHEKRQRALIALGDRLQQEASVENITLAASTIIGETLGVQLVGYGDADADAETITVEQDWTSGAAQTLAGTLRFRDFGSYIDDLKAGRTVIVRDCRTDLRTRDHAEALEARSARAFVNAPVIERGAFVALLYVSSDVPRDWGPVELAFIRDIAFRVRQAVERLRAAQQEEVLNGELAHRIKNTLSVVQAIAMHTLVGKADQGALDEFSNRLKALSSAHDVLMKRSWEAADFEVVAHSALASFPATRIRLSGPELRISSRTAMSLSLLLHELATNAVKYGALSVPEGEVVIVWGLRRINGVDMLEVSWSERGGPPAVEPVSRGFGSRLIRMGLSGSGGVKLRYGDQGLTVEMSAPLAQIQQA
ncbi:HWE histidine kinase domain-containing protein [Sphingomonas melonis]|uniref:PAS domain-containing sensor histidine kinase n=1 Tax=Sphingomonas melonis TaxID=152682 RepID=UPI0009F2CCBE|nr:HWE histidine kinase domain-containing protein [Sphingomonas melonis]